MAAVLAVLQIATNVGIYYILNVSGLTWRTGQFWTLAALIWVSQILAIEEHRRCNVGTLIILALVGLISVEVALLCRVLDC